MNNVNHRRKALFVGIMGASALLLAEGTMAQDDVTNLGIEEMVVTAQKREENVQAVPISISSLSANDIERRGVQSAADLMSTVPNMAGFQSPGARGNASIAMRGVTSGSPANLSIDSSIGIYIDGFFLGKPLSAGMDVAELERIEVLRGPQGTLYGRNSTGGAVNFITRKPSGEFGGKVSGTVGSDSLWGIKAAVDTPTLGTDGEGAGTLKGQFSAQTRQRDGLYDSRSGAGVDQEFDDLDRDAYRVALRWEPNDAVTFDYAWDKSKLDEVNTVYSPVGLTPYAIPTATNPGDRITRLNGYIAQGQAGLAGSGILAGPASSDPTFSRWLNSTIAMRDAMLGINSDGERPSRGAVDAASEATNESEGHSLTVGWNFEELGFLGDVEFKSMTGWRNAEARNLGDLDGFDNTVAPGGSGALNEVSAAAMYNYYAFGSILGGNASTAKLWSLIDTFGGGFFVQDAQFDYEQFSQELQMVGSTERLQYAVGLYYFEDNGSFDNYRKAAIPFGGILTSAYDNETEASAFYSQFTYTPPVLDDKLALTVGYRYTEEDKGIRYRYLTDVNPATGLGLRLPSGAINTAYTGELYQASTYGDQFDATFSNDSGNVTVAYQLTEDTNMFLRWATGYRSGGFNGELYNNPFEEETIEQVELGVKSDVVPGLLRINASVFQFTYEDLQTSEIRLINNSPTSYYGNAGEADRWGSEIEAQLSPTDNLMIALSWTHMSGNFEKYPPVCGTGTFSGECLPTSDFAERGYSPDNSASLVADWVFVRTDWADFMAHVGAFWQDEMGTAALWAGTYAPNPTATANARPYLYDHVTMDDRVVVNARVGIENVELSRGTLRAALWSNNLLDEDYPATGINFGSLGMVTEAYGEPRTFGLDVTFEF
ncbi:MAG: TonB-dependent receptor [Gammaproteobacteria bacterium]|nr:TonB-dependent receptor [Gammaproteobacteria bacterium]